MQDWKKPEWPKVILAKESGEMEEKQEMSVSTEEIGHCKLKVNYVGSTDVVKNKRQEAIEQLRKMPVSGFRPGKATDVAIKLHFKDRIEEWVKREMFTVANDDILFETKIRPLNSPNVEKSKLSGNNFDCELTYLVKPDFELKQYSGLEIPSPHMEKTEEEITEFFIQDLRQKHGDVRPYNDGDFVQGGDKVTLTYEISELDKKEEGQLYVVGSNVFPGFDDNIMGMAPGEERSFKTMVGNQEVTCNVTLHMGMKKVLCPADDALAQKCGLANLDELVSTTKVIAKRQYDAVKMGKIAAQIRSRLVADHDFEPPEWLINMEAQHVASQEGVKWEEIDEEVKKNYLERGKNNSKFTLILDSIRQKEPDTDVADAEAVEGIRRMVLEQGVQNADEWLQQAMKSGALYGMVAKFKNDYIVQWLVEHAKVIE